MNNEIKSYVSNKSMNIGAEQTGSIDDYEINYSDLIGKGRFATVHRAVHNISSSRVAVKIYQKHKIITNSLARLNLIREMNVLKKLAKAGCANVVKLHECIETKDMVLLVMEHVPGRPLDQIILESLSERECHAIL